MGKGKKGKPAGGGENGHNLALTSTDTDLEMTPPPPVDPPLTLSGQQAGNSATVALRWGISPALLEELGQSPEQKPFVLIVLVSPSGQEVERQLIPLADMMTFVQLRAPGRNRLLATVVKTGPATWENEHVLRDAFLARYDYGFYRRTVLQSDRRAFNEDNLCKYAAEFSIEVPKELFAKERPAWVKTWVNRWHRGQPPVDDCDFRKRAARAFTVQPPLVFSGWIISSVIRLVCAAFLLLCGFRGLNFRAIYNAEAWWYRDVWIDNDGSVFVHLWRNRQSVYGRLAFIVLGLLHPFVWVFTAVCLGFIALRVDWTLEVLIEVLITVAKATAVWIPFTLVALAVGYVLDRLVRSLFEPIAETEEQRETNRLAKEAAEKAAAVKDLAARQAAAARQRAEEEAERTRFQRDLALVLRNGMVPNVRALPRSRRTMHLLFWDMKTRVCKPFAQG